MALTDKQKRFCEEYLIDLNATQAAIRAGYSPKTAEQTASRLLRNVKVQEYIAKRQKELSRSTEITQERVIKELALIAFSNNADYAHVVEKKMQVEAGGALVDVLDKDGKPVMYRTVEPVLTEELTEEQKRALAVIKKGIAIHHYQRMEELALQRQLRIHLYIMQIRQLMMKKSQHLIISLMSLLELHT